jgi:hypothetical protein
MQLVLILFVLAITCSAFAQFDSNFKSLVHPEDKNDKLQHVLSTMPATSSYGLNIKRLPNSRLIHPQNPSAIITCALSTSYIARDVTNYVGTARKTGFIGDIVVAVLPNSNANFLARLQKFNTSVFVVDTTCSGKDNILCQFNGKADMPVTVIRFFVYQELIKMFSSSTKILISDFRDVFFQSNPFKYKHVYAMEKPNQIMFFQECHPNRVINRDSQNSYFISLCYGNNVGRTIGTNTISTSGIVIGVRDAVLAYVRYFVSRINHAISYLYIYIYIYI